MRLLTPYVTWNQTQSALHGWPCGSPNCLFNFLMLFDNISKQAKSEIALHVAKWAKISFKGEHPNSRFLLQRGGELRRWTHRPQLCNNHDLQAGIYIDTSSWEVGCCTFGVCCLLWKCVCVGTSISHV